MKDQAYGGERPQRCAAANCTCYIGDLGLTIGCMQTTVMVCYGLVLEPTGSLAGQSFVPCKKRDLYITI